jgi:hypothetical protein
LRDRLGKLLAMGDGNISGAIGMSVEGPRSCEIRIFTVTEINRTAES